MDQNTPQGRKSPLPWLLGILIIAALGVALWRYLAPAQPTNTSSPTNTALTNTNASPNSNSSPTANANTIDTAAWPSYSADGFSFRYPPPWTARPAEDPKAGIVLRAPDYQPVTMGPVTLAGEIYLYSIPNPRNLPVQDLFKTFSDTSSSWFDTFAHNNARFGTNDAVYFPAFTEGGPQRALIVIPGAGQVVAVSYAYLSDSVRADYEAVAATVAMTR